MIDRKLLWEGSLNILSQTHSREFLHINGVEETFSWNQIRKKNLKLEIKEYFGI